MMFNDDKKFMELDQEDSDIISQNISTTTRPMKNMYNKNSNDSIKRKNIKGGSSSKTKKNSNKTKDITTIESICNLFERVEYTKKTNAIKLNNICFSIPKADTYDFSSKGIRKGDCMEIVHEDKSNNTSISCMGYALESYNNNYNIDDEFGSYSPNENFVKCIILLRPESLPKKRLPWMGRRELFLSNFICYVPRNMMQDKVMVTSMENLPIIKEKRKNKQLYYSRVCYDIDNKIFFDYSNLQFLCLCVQPKNPDRAFIQCSYFDHDGNRTGCGALYHPRCVGTSRKIVGEIGSFKCPLCKRKTKERMKIGKTKKKMKKNHNSNNNNVNDYKTNEMEEDDDEVVEMEAKLETLSRIDPTSLMLGFERCQRHPNCSKPNRHPARCKLDRNMDVISSNNNSNSNSKKKKMRKKNSNKNNDAKRTGENKLNIHYGSISSNNNGKTIKGNDNSFKKPYVRQGFNFQGQGKGLLRLPQNSHQDDSSKNNMKQINNNNNNMMKKNSKAFSMRNNASSEANTPSRRKFVRKSPSNIKQRKQKSLQSSIDIRRLYDTTNRRDGHNNNNTIISDNTSNSSNNSSININDVSLNDGYGNMVVSPPPFSWASSIDMSNRRNAPKRPLSMNSVSDGEDNLIPGIAPLGSMEFDELANIPSSPMGVLRGGMSEMFLSSNRSQQEQQQQQQQQQQPKKVIDEILNSPLTKYSSPTLHNLFDEEVQPNVFALPQSLLGIYTGKKKSTRSVKKKNNLSSTNKKKGKAVKKAKKTSNTDGRRKKSIKRRKTSNSSSSGSDGGNISSMKNKTNSKKKVINNNSKNNNNNNGNNNNNNNNNNNGNTKTRSLFGKISLAKAKQSNVLSIFDTLKNPPPSPIIKAQKAPQSQKMM